MVAYRLSQRLKQDELSDRRAMWRQVAGILILFGILGLLTAWVYGWKTTTTFKQNFSGQMPASVGFAEPEGARSETIGPIVVKRYNEVYSIALTAGLSPNTWSVVGGEVQDQNKNPLFYFGKELWHETGYDSEGAWTESDSQYELTVTFPKPGNYYVVLEVESSVQSFNVFAEVTKRFGSSVPHTVFGALCLLVGIILNEILNSTITRFLRTISDD